MATIIGTDGDDILIGTAGDDRIIASAGADTIRFSMSFIQSTKSQIENNLTWGIEG